MYFNLLSLSASGTFYNTRPTTAKTATLLDESMAADRTHRREKVWIDCDPGHDDAFALMLAGHSPYLEVVGVSTSAGNQTLIKTTKNTLDILFASGLGHLPVYAGQEQPLLRPVTVCPEIHGDSGLGGPTVATHALALASSTPAFLRLHEVLTAHAAAAVSAVDAGSAAQAAPEDNRITIVCTGPLTNLALLLVAFPRDSALIRRVVLMGGAIGAGNTRPASEFNIEVDPEAAKVVFDAGIPVVMVPLEVTHTALVRPAVIESLRRRLSDNPASASAALTPFGRVVIDLLLFFEDSYREFFGFADGPPLHDPCAVFYLLAPECFKCADMRVDIETASPLCYGCVRHH
jgi:inosine-uridine nucleoside N-ribohydrolase